MFVRLLIALLASPWYGLLAVLATLPLLLIGALGWGLIASVLPQQIGPGTKLDDMAVLITMGLLLAVLLFALQIAVTVQMARYAAAFTGAIRLRSQPPFLRSFLRGLLVIVLVWVFFAVVSFVLSVLIGSIWIEAFDPASSLMAMQEWQANVEKHLQSGEAPGAQGSAISWTVLGMRATSMIYMVLLALIMVPYVCGISSESGLSWTVGYVLFRIVIAIPCLALMTAILVELLIAGVEVFSGELPAALRVLAVFGLEGVLFAGIIFAFEAMLLRGGREVAIEGYQAKEMAERRDPGDYSSMLRQRMNQD